MLLDICDRTGTGILSMIWPFAEFELPTTLFTLPGIFAAGVTVPRRRIARTARGAPLAAQRTVSTSHRKPRHYDSAPSSCVHQVTVSSRISTPLAWRRRPAAPRTVLSATTAVGKLQAYSRGLGIATRARYVYSPPEAPSQLVPRGTRGTQPAARAEWETCTSRDSRERIQCACAHGRTLGGPTLAIIYSS